MSELEIKANAEQYALKRIASTDLLMQARDKILIQDAYEKGFNDCYAITREEYEKLQERNMKAIEIIEEYARIQNTYFDSSSEFYSAEKELLETAKAFMKEVENER